MRIMRMKITPWQFGFMIFQIAALWIMPLLFKLMGPAGEITALESFVVWSLISLLPVAYDLMARRFNPQQNEDSPAGRFYLALSFLSLIAHMGFIHWIYRIEFFMTDLSPILLGLAINISYWKPGTFITRKEICMLRVVLPALAILFAMQDPAQLQLSMLNRTLSPITLILAGAYCTYIYIFAFRWLLWSLVPVVAVAIFAMVGPSIAQMIAWAGALIRYGIQLLEKLIPSTVTGWGILAMLTSFVMLILGGMTSYAKGQRTK